MSATTPGLAIPYSVATDRVTDFPLTDKAQAEALEAMLFGYGRASVSSQNTTSAVWFVPDLSALTQKGGFSLPTAKRLAVPKTGLYLVTAQALWSPAGGSSAVGARYMTIAKNSAGAPQTTGALAGLVVAGGGSDDVGLHYSTIAPLTANDYLEMGTFQSTTVSKAMTGGIQVKYLGPS